MVLKVCNSPVFTFRYVFPAPAIPWSLAPALPPFRSSLTCSHIAMSGKRGETHMQVCWHVTRNKRDWFRITHSCSPTHVSSLLFSHRFLHLACALLRANAVSGQQCDYCRQRRQRLLDAVGARDGWMASDGTARVTLHGWGKCSTKFVGTPRGRRHG